MDPVLKAWMFYNWLEDYHDEFELLKNQGYLIGSFTNPEAVNRMINAEKNTISTTSEEFEKTSQMILEEDKKVLQEEDKPRKRRRKKVIS